MWHANILSQIQRLKHLQCGDTGSIPWSGRSSGEGNDNPLQYSCLGNPMDGGAWWATVHGVAKSWTRLSDFTFMNLVNAWQKPLQYCKVISLKLIKINEKKTKQNKQKYSFKY